ncbi:hypothetical protein BD410DRAFT_794359 [Rickenella mellea]|uniref:F-box domain-containing protein n=1 Tax=Rickenella mellea TaxID=50990 RepID=A0A4Y7PPU7_9AGAM|nr:hypothetical protein BD410DRAFT_794359 [Rickenella mellea]
MNVPFRSLWMKKRRPERRDICPGPPLPAHFHDKDHFHAFDQASGILDGSQSLPNPVRNNGIDGFPPEILGDIFSLSQSDISPWTSEGRRWVYVAQVCRYWRQVALNLPNLWTSIDTSWRIIAPVFLRRSGNAPLDVKINLRERLSWRECHAINVALGQISRTRALHLNVEGVNELIKISSSQSRPGFAMSLQSLTLHSSIPLDLPPYIFAQTYSSLVSLDTSNIYMPFPPGLLCNLKNLKVYWVGLQRDVLTNMLSFVGTMEHCTKLERLEFHNKSGPLRVDIAPLHKNIFLPRLRHLFLTDQSSVTTLHLFSQLTMPVLTSVVLSGPAETSPSIPNVFASAFNSCFVSMDIAGVHTRLCSKVDPELIMEVYLRPLPAERRLKDCFLIFRSVVQTALPCLNTLILELDPIVFRVHPMTSRNWVNFLVMLPNLLDLRYRASNTFNVTADTEDGSAATLLDALSVEHSLSGMCCPKLQAMSFRNISFQPPLIDRCPNLQRICPCPGPREREGRIHKLLLRFVIRRSKQRMRLAMLDILGCYGIGYVPPEKLTPFVDKVFWDPLFCDVRILG